MDGRRPRAWFQIDLRANAAGSSGAGVKSSSSASPAASNGARAAAKKPFWADWGAALNRQSAAVGQNAQTWWTHQQKNAKKWKWEMPVRVDVDFLNPIVDSVKKTSRDVWRQLPPEVQRTLPYVAVAFTSSLIVYKFQHRKYVLEACIAQAGGLRASTDHVYRPLSLEEAAKSERLSNRVDSLIEERNDLRAANKELKAKALAPKSASEMRMAAAVAEATTAAAAAASAAASAASSCTVIAPRKAQ